MATLDDPRQQRVLEWLVTPPGLRDPKTKTALAAEFDVSHRTLNGWIKTKRFQEAWEEASRDVVGGLDKVQEVLEEMRTQALDNTNRNQVSAAKLYLDAVGAIKPPEKKVSISLTREELAEFSDEQLDQMIAQTVAQMENDG